MTESGQIHITNKAPIHYRHRDFFVGLFILIPIILLTFFILFRIIKVGLIEEWIELHAQFDDVFSLQKDAAVIFRGVLVGNVDRIMLSSDAKVDVYFSIRERFFPMISHGCRAHLIQKNFPIGDWQIHLKKEEGDWELKDGDLIPSQPPVSLESLIIKLDGLLTTIDNMGELIESGQRLLGQLLSKGTLSEEIQSVKQRMSTLLNEISVLIQRVDKTIDYADIMIGHMDEFGRHGTQTVDSIKIVGQEAQQLIQKLDNVSENIDLLTEELNTLPPELRGLVESMKHDLDEAEILIKGLQQHWLFRSAVNKARKQSDPNE